MQNKHKITISLVLFFIVLVFFLLYLYCWMVFTVVKLNTITTFFLINYTQDQTRTIDTDICDLKTVECPTGRSLYGQASWYDYTTPGGWSSIGERVCATRDFNKGETIRVTNLSNGKRVHCLVTDYGPDVNIFPGRVVDLSSYSFSQIANTSEGEIEVKIELIY